MRRLSAMKYVLLVRILAIADSFSTEVVLILDMGLNPILISTEDDDGGDAVSGTDPHHSLK